jgi:hypothetical protein
VQVTGTFRSVQLGTLFRNVPIRSLSCCAKLLTYLLTYLLSKSKVSTFLLIEPSTVLHRSYLSSTVLRSILPARLYLPATCLVPYSGCLPACASYASGVCLTAHSAYASTTRSTILPRCRPLKHRGTACGSRRGSGAACVLERFAADLVKAAPGPRGAHMPYARES